MAKSKYPEGPINQHKALATGAALPTSDTRNLGGGFEQKNGPAAGAKHTNLKSGTSTGKR